MSDSARTLGPRWTIALLCLANVALGAALAISAQLLQRGPRPHGPPPGPPGDPVARLTEDLDLDAAQAERVRAIFSRYHPEFERIEEERREQLGALRDRADAELREVLDDDQFARLLELRRRIEAREGPPPR